MAWSVITGGSSGIGLEFAHQLASQGQNLVLIARSADELESVKKKLRSNYAVKVKTIVADLSRADHIDQIAGLIRRIKELDYVVNNAGFGLHYRADDCSKSVVAQQQAAISVMISAVMTLSLAAVSAMRRRGRGHIINVSSISAWLLVGNYSAIKGYVLTYTRALNLVLKDSGITATAVCPSWVHTNFHRAIGAPEPAMPEWLYMPVNELVSKTLAAVQQGRSEVIPSVVWRVIIWFLQHGPVGLQRYVTKKYIGTGSYRVRMRD